MSFWNHAVINSTLQFISCKSHFSGWVIISYLSESSQICQCKKCVKAECKRGNPLASCKLSFLLICVFIKKKEKKLLLCLIDDASEMAAAEGVNKLNMWSIYIKRLITHELFEENQSFLCVFLCVFTPHGRMCWWQLHFSHLKSLLPSLEMLTQSAVFLNRRLMIMIYWGNNKNSCKKISDLKFNISLTLKRNGIQCIN